MNSTTQSLTLSFGTYEQLDVHRFDGSTGRITIAGQSGFHEASLYEGQKLLWSGVVDIQLDGLFELCVCASSSDEESILRWKELPPFFTVFDGGYNALDINAAGELLDDLITYFELVKVRAHFQHSGEFFSEDCQWGDQENLKTLSEVFLGLSVKQKIDSRCLTLLEIELFETVYFLIGEIEEVYDDGIIVSLTNHVYSQKNRIGRRIPIRPILTNNLQIVEVSDLGLKAVTDRIDIECKQIIEITIEDHILPFRVTYRYQTTNNAVTLGLAIVDHSSSARKSWQRFLLQFQYPLLKYRQPEDHEIFWSLYYETGFMNFPYTEMVRRSKESIFQTWSAVDSAGPDMGASVIGLDGGKPVSSIGVARAAKNVWVAQAANTIAEPKYMQHTRSMYSWRTRFMLQQVDGDYHLAFIHRDKKFLDRFFRKFYLLHREGDQNHRISWDEWKMYVMKNLNNSDSSIVVESSKDSSASDNKFKEEKLFERFINAGNPTLKIGFFKESVLSQNRPHLHMTQYLTSVWLSKNTRFNQGEVQRLFDSDQPFYSVYSPIEEDAELVAPFKDIGKEDFIYEGWHVVWMCHRDLLPKFLQNSLKSLEIMNRKYGNTKAS